VRASWSFRQIENYEVVDFRPPDGSYVQNVTYRAIVIPAQGCVECGPGVGLGIAAATAPWGWGYGGSCTYWNGFAWVNACYGPDPYAWGW